MARPTRIHYKRAMYHVFARGVNKMTIFHDSQDYRKFLKIVRETKDIIPFELFTYVLMPNHFHFLVRVIEAPTGVFMHQIMARYAMYYRLKYGWVGHVFQGRYRAILCQSDPYLLELLRYIPLNPVRAGLVADPSDWAWSGHREYLGETEFGLVDRKFPLSVFCDEPERALERYERYVYSGIKMKHRKDFYPRLTAPVIGSPLFKHSILKLGRPIEALFDLDSVKVPAGLAQ